MMNKKEVFAEVDVITADFSKAEKESMINFMERIKKFMTKEITAKDLEMDLLLGDTKTTNAGFKVMDSMYPDRVSASELFGAQVLKEDKICQKCGGIGNVCKVGINHKTKKAYSVCALCQMEAF